jgi:glycosyltransferase involved in cell wall biosynthesis
MLSGRNIVCFAPNDWWGMNPSCATHIMLRLARHNKVLFVNPFSSDLGGAKRKGIFTRLLRKTISLTRFLRRPHKNLYVFSPLFIPLHGRPFIDRLNNTILKFQMALVCRIIRISKPILWVENLRASDIIGTFDAQAVVYHVSDLFAKCKYTANTQALEMREQNIIDNSDLVICVSEHLYSLLSSKHPSVHYIPHGVDFQLFRHAAESDSTLPELARIPRPIAGYFGTLTANNDIDLLSYCARNLPDFSFVFAGQITGGDYSQLMELPNVFHLGKLPYQKIPILCASFDVCVLAWKVTDWIRSCNPLKLFEYMASGKPIVSVRIDEVTQKYPGLVSVAGDKEQFCKMLLHELKNDTPQRARLRIQIASEYNWDAMVLKISALIAQAISHGAQPQPTQKVPIAGKAV